MKEFKYTITDELGIHARPAGLLVKKAAEFASTVSVDNGTKKGDAKKIMSPDDDGRETGPDCYFYYRRTG